MNLPEAPSILPIPRVRSLQAAAILAVQVLDGKLPGFIVREPLDVAPHLINRDVTLAIGQTLRRRLDRRRQYVAILPNEKRRDAAHGAEAGPHIDNIQMHTYHAIEPQDWSLAPKAPRVLNAHTTFGDGPEVTFATTQPDFLRDPAPSATVRGRSLINTLVAVRTGSVDTQVIKPVVLRGKVGPRETAVFLGYDYLNSGPTAHDFQTPVGGQRSYDLSRIEIFERAPGSYGRQAPGLRQPGTTS